MKIGSLFTGYGGLDMAVEEVFDAETVWVSDIKPAAVKLLSHRRPGIPNLGDITKIDWSQVEPVDIITGGFPCTDVSAAGRRAGLIRYGDQSTRSGLWSEMCRAVDQLRPSLMVAENVRGLFSAKADSDVESCAWCVGDGSAFDMRAFDAVLGDLADIGHDAAWHGLRAADVGLCHGRWRVFIVAWPTAADAGGKAGARGSGFRTDEPGGVGWSRSGDGDRSPTDTRSRGRDWIQGVEGVRRPTTFGRETLDHSGDGYRPRDENVRLLPTPVANDSGNSPEDHLRKKPGREVVTSLAIIAANDLFATGGRLLPTPRESDGVKGGPNQRGSSGDLMLPSAVMRFGEYGPAVERHTRTIGRAAPSPTETGPKGGERLSPRFTEWMMGLPQGWITDVTGLSRNEQLSLCGDGVVPQQASAALRYLLEAAA